LHCLNEPRSLPRRLCDDVVPVRSTRADGHGEMVEQWDDTTCISYGCNYILWAGEMKRTILEAFERWKSALVDLDKQTTQVARHRAHARVTSMEDLIDETPADDLEGVGIKLALYVYISGVDPETADSAVEQVLSAYKDCVRVLGRDFLAEVKSLMPACQQGV
jgi:hypothetical protein